MSASEPAAAGGAGGADTETPVRRRRPARQVERLGKEVAAVERDAQPAAAHDRLEAQPRVARQRGAACAVDHHRATERDRELAHRRRARRRRHAVADGDA